MEPSANDPPPEAPHRPTGRSPKDPVYYKRDPEEVSISSFGRGNRSGGGSRGSAGRRERRPQDDPRQQRRQKGYYDYHIPTFHQQGGGAKRRDSGSDRSYYSSSDQSSHPSSGYIPSRHMPKRQVKMESSSPISSLNSTLSNKLGSLHKQHSTEEDAVSVHSQRHPPRRIKSREIEDDISFSSNSFRRREEYDERLVHSMQRPSRSSSSLNKQRGGKSRSFHDDDRYVQHDRRNHPGSEDYVQERPRRVMQKSRSRNYDNEELDFMPNDRTPPRRGMERSRSRNYDDAGYVKDDRMPSRQGRRPESGYYEDDYTQQNRHPQDRSTISKKRSNHYEYEFGEEAPRNNDRHSQYRGKAKQRSFNYEQEGYLPQEQARNNVPRQGRSRQATRSSYYDDQDYDDQDDSQSLNSLNRRMVDDRRGRDYKPYPEEEDDYFVGEEVHLNTNKTARHLNSSYNEFDDEESGSGGKEYDAWSMAKSAFSTLPDHHRKSFDIYYNDDDTPSLSASSRGPVSRSSSIHSHLSKTSGQSSHRSQGSRRQSSRKLPINSVAYDESDHSLGSILSGFEDDLDVPVVDSSSVVSDHSRSRRRRNQVDGNWLREASPNSQISEKDSPYFLFDLEGLGLNIEVPDDEASAANDEASHDSDLHELTLDNDDKDEHRPWWIQQLEDEGMFEFDTTTVYSTKMPAKHQFGRDIHHTLAETMGDAAIAENTKAKDKADSSDTSTIGEDDDVGDWEERLWTLARKYYKEYSGGVPETNDAISFAKSLQQSVTESVGEKTQTTVQTDIASIKEQEKLFSEEFETEQQGVLKFRSILLTCIQAYVEAFHAKPSKEDDPLDNTSEFNLAEDGWKDEAINLDVNHYVPLATARDLFEEVINMIDDGTIFLSATETTEVHDAQNVSSISAKKRAELMVSAIIEDNLNIFRKYQVVTVQESTKLTSASKQPKSRMLLNKSGKHVVETQTELDKYLYGDVNEDEDKKEEGDDVNHDVNVTLETEEYEIRLRSAVIANVAGKSTDAIKAENVSWAAVVAKVMLVSVNGAESNTHERHNQPDVTGTSREEERPVNDNPSETLQHTQPLAELYTLRHTPAFVLRAIISQNDQHVEDKCVNIDDLSSILTNKAYIKSRFELQGPYDGTLSHLSNFHDLTAYQNNMKRMKQDDTNNYLSLHKLLVSALYSHLETTLKHSGFQLQHSETDNNVIKQVQVEDKGNDSSDCINIKNYANIVAICLEVGRALHYLGLCLGRRQRDSSKEDEPAHDNLTEDIDDKTKQSSQEKGNTVSLEIAAYRYALEAYRGCLYIFSKAEHNTLRDLSVAREQNELQLLREAKMSVELHLADTLTCVGFCHDTKLREYDAALLAYRESLSFYIRHVGRFHTMVSNTLHNMGTIHVELKQWGEAAGCFRQCLSIIKRKEEQEKLSWIKSHGFGIDEEDQPPGFVSSMNEDIACTLECLATSLSMLEEYDASLVCLQQAIDRIGTTDGTGIYDDRDMKIPSASAGGLLSQAASLFVKQASKLSHSLNWECHMMLFSGKGKTDSDLSFLLASQIKKEQSAKDFIQKAILSRRHHCYADTKLAVEISPAATSLQLESLAQDLITAGRLEFRERSYDAAISYFYEALVINTLTAQRISSHDKPDESRGLFVFDNDSLKAGKAALKLTSAVLGAAEAIDDSYIGPLSTQILSLIGIAYTRTGDNNKAKAMATVALKGAKTLAAAIKHDMSALEEMIAQVDIAFCQLRLASIISKLGDSTAIASLQEAIEMFDSAAHKLNALTGEELNSYSERLQIVINNGLATVWHLLGKVRMNENNSYNAMECFEKAVKILNSIQDTRLECSDPKSMRTPLSFAKCLLWEDPTALSTTLILSDANERSAQISEDESFSLDCFDRAIGMREFFVSKLGSLDAVDNETAIECFDELQWDKSNMDSYSSLLKILGSNQSIDEDEDDNPESEKKSKTTALALTKEDVLFRMGNLQAKLGLIKDAIKSYKEADDLTVERLGTKDHMIVANIQHNMGNAYRQLVLSSIAEEQKDFAKERAMACYSESIRISTALFGKNHSSSAESIQSQGILYMETEHSWFDVVHEERDEEEDHIALDMLKESLNIRKKDKDSGSNLEHASTLYLAGNLCLRLIGRNSLRMDAMMPNSKLANDAINFLLESLKIRNLLLGEDHLDCINTLQSLGQAHLQRSLSTRNKPTRSNEDIEKALEALNSSLNMRSITKKHVTSPFENPLLAKAQCLYLLGQVEEARENLDEAKSNFVNALRQLQTAGKQVVAKLRKESDGRHLTNMEAINLLAARVLNSMAIIHRKKHSFEECLSLLNKCLQIRGDCKSVKRNGLANAHVETQLARTLLDKDDADASIEYFSRSLRTYLKFFGKDSLDVAETLFCMGRAFSLKKRFQKSLLCYDKSMRIYEFKEPLAPKEKLGDLHREIGRDMMLNGGDLYDVLEHYRSSVSFLEVCNDASGVNDKLIRFYSEMLSIMRDVFDSEENELAQAELTDEIGDVLHRMGNLYASSGEHNKAMNCFSEVLDIQRRRHTDSKELRISDILFNMGNIYVELNQPEKALHCLDQSYSITKEALGNHKELHSTMYLIGVAWSELEELENALEWFTSALSVLETKTEEEAFLDADEAARGRTLYRLGQVCEQLGDNQKALSCFQDCAKILKVTRSNDLEMSNALFSMGNLLLYSSDYDRALSCYDQSLRIRLEIGDEVMVTKIKHSIGLALSDVGELNRALAFLADVLRTFSKQQGAISLDTGKLLMSVGQNYLNQGLHSLAMNYFEAAVSVIEADQDSALDTAVCLYSIGVIQDSSSDEGSIENYRQAISLFNDGKESAKSHFLAMPMQKYDSVLASCLHSAAKFYAKKDNHSEALRYMSEAFELKKEIFGLDHESTAASQHWLGAINLALEEDELALMNFKGSLKIRVSLFGTEHKDVAATLYGLAEVHFKRDELAECLECINENLRISSRLGSEDSVLSRSKLMLGSCYQELGQYEQAKEHLSESLRMLISVHGGERHLDVADAHFRLGICYCETTEYEKSLVHFKSCLSTRSHMLGNLDLECANTYESLGIVQQKMNSHQDALSSFERALAIKRTSLPDVDEDISVLLHFIGTSLFAIEKYDDSLHYFSSSADIKKQLHGDGDQEYAMSLLDKAAALEKIGDVRRSVECYSESIESRALPLDSWELGIAHKSMARYFHSQNNIGSSFDSYNEAISIFEWIMESESSPSVAQYEDVIECYVRLLDIGDEPISEDRGTTCYKLANCYVQAGKMKDAISMYREAIMIQSQIFGVDSVSVANSLHNLGNCYRDYGDFERSVECLTKALGILTLALGEDHEDVADTCHCLGVTMRMRCEFQEAVPLFERALTIRKKKLGPQHISTASSLYNLALVSQMKGDWAHAIKHCKEALRIQRTTLGDNNRVTMNTLECAGRIHYGKHDFENALKCFKSSYDQGNIMLLREIGLIYKDRGELDKATLMFNEAASYMVEVFELDVADQDLFSSLTTRKQHTKEQDLIKLADDIMYYGSVLTLLDKLNEALTCFRLSNMIYQAKYVVSDHLAIAENMYWTGFVLEKLDSQSSGSEELNEALDILAESSRIRQLHLEDCHPDLAETLFILAKVHHKLGNEIQALRFLTDAVECRGTKSTQFVDYDSLLQVGQMQKQYGRYQEALRTYEACLDLKLRHVGPRHSSIAELNFFMGDLLREAGDFDLAESKFKESLKVLELTGSCIISVADVYFSVGILYTEQEKFNLALDSFMKSLQGRKLETFTTKVDMAELLNNIGICYCGMKEYDKAQVYHAEALESLIEELGYDHIDVGFCWHSLGTVHTELHDVQEALSCFRNAVRIERTELYLQSLGICLVQLNDYEDAFVCLSEALQMKKLDFNPDDDMAEIERHLGIIWMKREKYEEALTMFEEALKVKVSLSSPNSTEKFHQNLMECFISALESVAILFGSDHLRYAKLLHQKGNIHGSKNEHPLAIEAYIETLRIYKQHYGDSHLSVANTLFNLGISLNAKGAPEKGLRCFVKALRISKAKLGDDHLDVADTYEQMATSNKLMQNNREAINFFDKALNIRKILTGGNELKSAAIMHEIGKINIEQSNLGSAESAFKESLRIRTTQLGQDDALVAESMFHLGCLYKSRNDMASALKYHEECLRINKSKSDTELSHMADIFASLGDIHSSLGRTLKSTRCYSEAVKLYRLAQSPQDEKVVSCLARQGHVYAAAMHFAKALSCFSECLDLTRLLPDGSASSMAEDRAFALTRMGEIYSTIGNVTEASSHFALALAAYKHIFGPNHLHVASVLQKMAGHFVKVKEFERGYSCAKEAQAMRENLLGKNDSETADSHYFMGKILFECSRYNESIKYMERARRIHLKKYGKMSSQVANENFLLGTICERKADNSSNSLEKAQSELDAAVEYLQDSLTARRERLDKEDPEIAVTLTRLGHVYYKLSAYDNAVDCFSESLKLREANRDNDPATQLLVADALFDLGTALNKALDTKRSLQLFTDALKEYQMLLDKNHLSIAKCLSCIGGVHEKENELSEAIKYLDRAGRIYEYNFGVGDPNANVIKSSNLDGDYAHQADTFYILGTAHDRMGNGSKSLQLYRRTLKIYKTLFGRDSLQVAKVLNRLANMKGRTGSVEKAMVLFDESLRIRMLHLGNNHEDVAETLFGMGIVFEKRKNYPAAMKAYSDCLRIRSSRHGSDSMEVAQVVVNIGVVRGNKGDFSGALKSWNKALAIYRKHGLKDEDALVATVLSHQHLATNLIKNRGRSKR